MNIRIMGAIFVILGCGSFGFSMAASHRREEAMLRQLQNVLQFMYCELQFHLTPLPELCLRAANQGKGAVGDVFARLSRELEKKVSPSVADCMELAVGQSELSPRLRSLLLEYGKTLGLFDLAGQLRGIEGLRQQCSRELEQLMDGKQDRLRSYQTLGLCAGAALVILFV